MFGISQDIESIKEDEGFKAFHDKRSYLYQGGPGGKVYWFFFLKNKTRTIRNDIPRYNKDDEKFIANKYASDSVGRGLTFGDLYQQRQTAVFVPLEEYVLRSPFYKRVILVGDSYHKVRTRLLCKGDDPPLINYKSDESPNWARWERRH